jgi:hypothetical protein
VSSGTEGARAELDFGFPAVSSAEEVAIAIGTTKMGDDFFDHKDAGPSRVVTEADVGDVAMRVFGTRGTSGTDDLAAQTNPHHRDTEARRL